MAPGRPGCSRDAQALQLNFVNIALGAQRHTLQLLAARQEIEALLLTILDRHAGMRHAIVKAAVGKGWEKDEGIALAGLQASLA